MKKCHFSTRDRNSQKVPEEDVKWKEKYNLEKRKTTGEEQGELDQKIKVRQIKTHVGAHVAHMN